ncbi:kinase-like protein [Gigaspora margarita]|uniref:Kinase-like protein n=1 Tax=Gigaspora margarita TaxID=4874 RepID=A0A8H4B4A2_GIGMA|nr:kinase-like protein [Gigaspora margarita]
MGNFMLVLEFADSGNLRDYLKKKHAKDIYRISWTELIKIAKEITLGLTYLHSKSIIHRDLHSNNILINNGRALISDFGISKQLNDTTASSSVMMGVPAYIDPQYLKNGHKLDMKSDIYSLGVLFWELTSGIPPFFNIPEMAIILEILNNNREKIIDSTPLNYSNLYKKCWASEPKQRPTLNEISDELENLSSETTIEFITNTICKDNQKNIQVTTSN